jgi:hypothetical protein
LRVLDLDLFSQQDIQGSTKLNDDISCVTYRHFTGRHSTCHTIPEHLHGQVGRI